MEYPVVLVCALGVLVGLGVLEIVFHRRNLARIPIRIHVNGTRGKSSVTRLVAAGLREGGLTTCAKTTGTLARMILPDGAEFPVFRPSQPNVLEQVRIFRKAAAYNAQALVMECMAVQPPLQALSERMLVRATHGVITNARQDHLDVMGPTGDDVALALAGTVPPGAVLYTAERKRLPAIAAACDDRMARLVSVGAQEVAEVGPEDLAGFSYVEHADNVALALRICADFGVDRATALRGMWAAQPDPGVMTDCEIHFFGGRRIYFANGFAANDPESSETVWRMMLARHPQVATRIIIFNLRADRPDRSRQFAEAVADWPAADHYVLIGTGTYLFARTGAKHGLDPRKVYFAEQRREGEIFEIVVDLAGESALVVGLGNIAGQGLDLVRFFANRSLLKRDA